MAHYTNITAEEMEQFLAAKGFAKIALPGTIELVYGKRVKQDDLQLSLRCYTGIAGENSRKVGEDAIRVNLWMRTSQGRLIKLGGSKRVHRVEGWRNNLGKRLDDWLEYMPTHKCDKCGLPMIVRNSSKGKFLGCSGYPDCRNAKSIEKDKS